MDSFLLLVAARAEQSVSLRVLSIYDAMSSCMELHLLYTLGNQGISHEAQDVHIHEYRTLYNRTMDTSKKLLQTCVHQV